DLAVFSPVQTSYTSTSLDFASLAVPVTLWKKPVTFQGSWRRLYTLDYREVFSMTKELLVPEGKKAARIDTTDDLVGSVNVISVAGAVKLTSRLAVGGSFNFGRGDWSQDVAIAETTFPAGSTGFVMGSETDHVSGNNFNVGLLLTYARANVGLVYQ